MKRIIRRSVLLAAGIVLVSALVAGVQAYHTLNPENRFVNVTHPVLAIPGAGMYDTAGAHDLKQTNEAQLSAQTFAAAQAAVGTAANRHDVQSAAPPAPVSRTPSPQAEESSTFNVLILGIDARSSEVSRTDMIMVAHVDPERKTANLLSIPRDSRVFLKGIGFTKINHAHVVGALKNGNRGGTEATIQAVSDMLNIPINYFVKINFEGFEHMIDSIGGVELNLPREVVLDQPLKAHKVIILQAGEQTLNGESVLDFVRERYSRKDGDFGRQTAQMDVIKSLARKLTRAENLPKLPGLIRDIKKEVLDTNFNDADLLSLAWLFKNTKGEQLRYFQVPGQGLRARDPLVEGELYYWEPDTAKLDPILAAYFHGPNPQ